MREREMNTYRFELEYNDGFIDTYETCGINLHMAHEMLIEYLKELPNPKDIVQISAECISGEDDLIG
jgi:hypothetical protein